MIEAHKIGIALAMTSNHAQVFQAITAGLLGVHTHVNQLTGGFNNLKLAIGGAMAVWAGDKILRGLNDILLKAKDLSHELTQIEKLGGEANTQAANANAQRIIENLRGITQAQALHIYGQTYGLIGNQHALEIQERLAKYSIVSANTRGGQVDDKEGRDLVRAAEQTGRLTDPNTKHVDMARFNRFLDMQAKIQAATEGQFGAAQMYQLTQQAGLPLANMSDRGIEEMAILSQYMGAPRAGTALMSINQQFSGTMWKRNAVELQRLGLLNPGEYQKNGGGGIMLTPAASERLQGLMHDPLKFVTDTLVPAMEKAGIKSPEAQSEEIFRIFGRQTSQRLMSDILRNAGQMGLELGRLETGQSLDQQYNAANLHDVEQNLNNVSVAWTNFLTALGGPNSERYISILHGLTDALNGLTSWANNNPTAVQVVITSLAGLGAGLVALGVVMTGAAVVAAIGALSVGGVVIVGIAALATAVGTLAALHWDELSKYINQFGESIKTLWEKIKSFFTGDTGPVNPGTVPDPRSPGAPGYMPMSYTLGGLGGGGGGGGFRSGGGYTLGGGGGGGSGGGPGGYSDYLGSGNSGEFSGTGGFNFMGSPAASAMGLNVMPGSMRDMVTRQTAVGKITANKYAADDIAGFINDLHAAGAPLNNFSGVYNPRRMRGGRAWSQHAYGNAIDIETGFGHGPDNSPFLWKWAQAHPKEFADIQSKHHMKNLSSFDWGHFEWSPTGRAAAALGGGAVGSSGPVDRSRFASLIDNPAFVARMASMAHGEVGLDSNIKTQMAITEEAFNRWDTRDQQAGKDLFHGRGGYYAADTFRHVSPAQIAEYREKVLRPVLAGSNILRGMTGNASNDYRHHNLVALHQFQQGTPGLWLDLKSGEVTNLPASYGGGKAEAFFMEKGAAYKHPVTMRHDSPAARFTTNSNWGMGLSGTPAVPPHKDKDVHLHMPVHLDGRKIAENTVKHMVGGGQRQPGSPRLADYNVTRPAVV